MLKQLVNTLKERKLTLACAESASGGYVSYLLTKTPGSSRVFKGAVVAYSLEAKNKFLRIPWKILNQPQGVSGKITGVLAENVKNILNADIGAAITGFAGPGDKNTGLMFLAVSYKNNTMVKKVVIKGNRDKIRKEASRMLVKMIYDYVGTGL